MSGFKKGQKVWLCRMNTAGMYDVQEGRFVEMQGDVPFVRIPTMVDGVAGNIVIDCCGKHVFPRWADAIRYAACVCLDAAKRYQDKAHALILRLGDMQ